MNKLQFFADKTAISLSLLCAVHCLAMPLLVLSIPSLTSLGLDDEAFHLWMLVAVIPISTLALFMGCKKHRRKSVVLIGGPGLAVLCAAAFLGHDLLGEFMEKALTVLGATLIALGHVWNYRLCRSQRPCACPAED